jgi:alpha-tubulin suppressor-like RCC1 family protein
VAVGAGCSAERQLETGLFNTCVVHDGGVVCWGAGSTGALGRGPYDGGRLPGFVEGVSNPTALGFGDSFGCAMLSSGMVRCWGDNGLGQVGNGGAMPVFLSSVTIGANARLLTLGAHHGCAGLDDAGVSCWGSNSVSQLAQPSTTPSVRLPLPIPTPAPVVAAAAGSTATWLTLSNGTVLSSGSDFIGFSNVFRPVTLSDGGVHRIVAAFSHACLVRADTRLLECWGRGREGQLGYSTTATGDQPVRPVAGLGPVADVCVGLNFTCALIPDGGVRCFGAGASGQLGTGNFGSASAPTPTDVLPPAIQVSCHHNHACALTSNGVYCWGDNNLGQLGAPAPVLSASPIRVTLP